MILIKKIKLLYLFFLTLNFYGYSLKASTYSQDYLFGTWLYHSYLLNGVELPKANPHLHIEFHFFEDGENRLYWYRINEKGFCERKARYSLSDQYIWEVVTWVNPQNNIDCGGDPDMQNGRRNKIAYYFDHQGRLYTRVMVADQELWYIWKKKKE